MQSKTKQIQLNIYLSSNKTEADAQAALLKQAAKLAHRSMSNFILTAALEAAEAGRFWFLMVWRNPLGFSVTSYRIDAETLDAAEGRG